jgi:acyl carrier protein
MAVPPVQVNKTVTQPIGEEGVLMVSFAEVQRLIGEVLQLGDRARTLDRSTPFMGNLPELDSVSVLALLVALEERFGIAIHDDEINAADFATVGSFYEFINSKLAAV